MVGYVALGSNLGDRENYLRQGLSLMRRRGVVPIALSSVWETEPVDCPDPFWFLNMVAEVETFPEPMQVLDALLSVERELGRVRLVPNGSRILDLDLLLLGDTAVTAERLTLPHPRMWSRGFVLAPLAELAPGLRNPLSGRTVAEELLRTDDGALRIFGTLQWEPAGPYNPGLARSVPAHEVQLDCGRGSDRSR